LAIGYFTEGGILVGWCESRNDYRHFRTDRLTEVVTLDERYPRSRCVLFHEWREKQLHDEQAGSHRRKRST
jgi:predicted DNA-binding transcriptional regulator YafY